jgi:rod shape-determining protein MreD
MRKFILIAIFVISCFIIQTVMGQVLGRWCKPNLLIILIVFFNFFRGTRSSVIAAFIAGLLQDSFSAKLFGLNIFSLIVCANLITFFKMYLYQAGSTSSRVETVLLVTVVNLFIQYAFNAAIEPIYFTEVIRYVMLPEVVATVVVTPFVFEKLKQCALKSFA